MTTGQPANDANETAFHHQRVIPHPLQAVFAAFQRPELLARWWGPDGFTNTFEVFEFKAGGRWKFVMHGPDGANYPNESVFAEISSSKIIIKHVNQPHFDLTVTLAAKGAGTEVGWVQDFGDSAVAARLKAIVVPANEQNLDRLVSVLAGG